MKNKKLKVLTIGGATKDIYLENDPQETGSKIEVSELSYFSGGGATNSAASFVRLGFDARCVCALGDDETGEFVLQDLEREGIGTKYVKQLSGKATGTSFIIKKTEYERTIFAYRGANCFLLEEHIPFDAIANANLIYITSLSGDSSHVLNSVVTHAKKNKVPVFMNPGKSQLMCAGVNGCSELKLSLSGIYALILNANEAKAFIDVELDQFFKEVLAMGPEIVVVTDGANGVHVGTKDGVTLYSAEKVTVVDTVGAGDAFGSCFAASIVRGESIETAVRYGMHNAASVIGKLGAKTGLPRRSFAKTGLLRNVN